MGKNEEWLIKLAIEEGRPIPQSIMDAPVLDEVSVWYYRRFGALSRSRGFTSNGVSLPITFESIDRYADRLEYEDFDEFLTIMAGIDEEYLKSEAKRRSAEERKSKRDAKRNARKGN